MKRVSLSLLSNQSITAWRSCSSASSGSLLSDGLSLDTVHKRHTSSGGEQGQTGAAHGCMGSTLHGCVSHVHVIDDEGPGNPAPSSTASRQPSWPWTVTGNWQPQQQHFRQPDNSIPRTVAHMAPSSSLIMLPPTARGRRMMPFLPTGASSAAGSSSSSLIASGSLLPAAAGRGFFNGAMQEWLSPERQVTNALIAACTAAFLIEMMNPGIIQSYSQINLHISMRGEYYRLVTSAFLHGGPLHLLGNMLALHWMGPEVERTVGQPCFLTLYMAGALGGGVMHYYMGPMASMVVGASGAIAGILAATLVFKLRNKTFVPFTSADVSWIGQIIALNVMVSVFMGGVAHWGHAGGFLGGGLAMYLLGPRYVWSNGSVVSRPLIPIFRNSNRR